MVASTGNMRRIPLRLRTGHIPALVTPMLTKVLEVRPDGAVLVVTDPNEEARPLWLPASEWSSGSEDWTMVCDQVAAGQEIDVVAMPGMPEVDGMPSVSRRRLDFADVDDSWLYQPRIMVVDSVGRTVIRGSVGNVPAVMRLERYQAYLDRRQPSCLVDHDALGRGDMLGGMVTRIWTFADIPDSPTAREFADIIVEEECVELDPEWYLRELAGHPEADEAGPGPSEGAEEDPRDLNLPLMNEDVVSRIGRVLLVEDEARWRDAMATVLGDCGIAVDAVGDLEAARSWLDNHKEVTDVVADGSEAPHFLAVIDPNLEFNGADLSGLRVAEMLSACPNCRILVVTGELSQSRKTEIWGHLQVHGYLRKPFMTIELLEAIEETLSVVPMPLREHVWGQYEGERDPLPPKQVHSGHTQDMPKPKFLSAVSALKDLCDVAPGTVAHLFVIHPRSLRARSLASVGAGLRWEPLRGKVGKSLIRDAAFSQGPIVEGDSSNERRHRYTLKMMRYESFFGHPLDVEDYRRYCIVGFHPQVNAFSNDTCLAALQLCAERIARIVERERLTQTADDELVFVASGMTLESLAHELSTDISTVEAQATVLQRLLQPSRIVDETTRDEAAGWVGEQQSKLSEMMAKMYVLRGVRGERRDVPVEDCLRRAAIGCKALIAQTFRNPERVRVTVPDRPGEDPMTVQTVPAALAVVFFNLYLNAAQQIQLASGIRSHGSVWHSIERRVDRDGKPWGLVRIHDTGPGIHSDDWERVFESGVTTKEGGTGLGLHICRHLLGKNVSVKGRSASIGVTRSVVWGGTTVTVKLPLDTTGQGALQ